MTPLQIILASYFGGCALVALLMFIVIKAFDSPDDKYLLDDYAFLAWVVALWPIELMLLLFLAVISFLVGGDKR